MKKKLVVYLAGLLTVLSVGFGSAQFSDVPAGHWAQEAVERIAACGLITGFPDGTFRGNQNLTRYQAALIFQRLLNEIQNGGACVKADGSGMSNEDMDAIRNAVQELAAELAALGVRVSALEDNSASKDDIAALQAALDEMKAGMGGDEGGVDAAALTDLADRVEAASVAADTALAQAEQLAERLDAAEAAVAASEANLAALQTQVEADADSIRALNELAVLLNQDVLSLQDRVTALEKNVGEVDFESFATKEDVSAIQEFSTALRSDLVKLSDRVTDLSTRVTTLERNAFTISGSLSLTYQVRRAWGVDTDPVVAGIQNRLFDMDRIFTGTTFSSGDVNADGLVIDETDLGDNSEGRTTANLDVTFRTGKFGATSSPGKYNTYPDLTQFSIRARLSDADAVSGEYSGENAVAASYFRIYVDSISTTLTVAGGQPLNFSFGRSPRAKFTEYVYDNDGLSRGPGFVANIPFPILDGKTQFVYGSLLGPNGDNRYYRGVRVSFGLGPINLGSSFVQEGVDQVPGNGAAVTPITVGGFDASANLGGINLMGEYFTSDGSTTANGFYVKADAALGPINLGASYRSIGAGVTSANMLSRDATDDFDESTDYNAAPFQRDQAGFGVNASASLGIISLGGYFQNYTLAGAALSAFGVNAKVGLGPVALEAYFGQATSGGVGVASIEDEKIGSGTYRSAFGVKVSTAGTLIPNLNLTASYDQVTVAPNTTTIRVYGDYALNAGIISAKLMGRFESVSSGVNTVKYGVQLSTQPLFMGISLFADAVSRTTGTTTEGLARGGIRATNLIFNNSSLSVSYGGYGGGNLTSITVGDQDNAFNAADNDIYTTPGLNAGELKGFFVEWSYWDLTFSYANFDLNNNGAFTHGEAFKIRYTVTF